MANPARRQSQSDEVQSTDRMRVACAKAREAFSTVAQHARDLNDELDDVTSAHVITAELHEEDSAVIVVREMIGSLAPKP